MGCGAVASQDNAHQPTSTSTSGPSALNNKFIKKQLIGTGTYGKVYRCVQTNNGKQREYALKMVELKCKTKEEAIRQIANLKSEISVLKKINHPNIIKYQTFDVSVDSNSVEIVLELVKGGSLKDYIEKNGALTESQAAIICKGILSGISYLHSKGIIHRDLKCANILLGDNLEPKITDFGTAREVVLSTTEDIAKFCASLKGTPYYMAPEMLKRTGHNKKADIWSFGCTLIEMLTGKPPWTTLTRNFQEIISYIVSGVHPPYPKGVSKVCECFLKSCLDSTASSRLSAQQLLKHRFIEENRVPRKNSGLYIQEPEAVQDIIVIEEMNSVSASTARKDLNFVDESFEYDPKQVQREKPLKKHLNKMNSIQLKDQSKEYVLSRKQKKQKAHLKKEKGGHLRKGSKTTAFVKNTEKNLQEIEITDEVILPSNLTPISNEISYSSYMRSNTETSYNEEVIDTRISRQQRNRYLDEQIKFRKLKEDEKRKWEQQLQQGASLLRKQISKRYIH